MKNLDLLAAKAAHNVIENTERYSAIEDGKKVSKVIKASEVDNLITKSLGVLQENGVYAALLYLYSRTSGVDKIVAEKTREELLDLTTNVLELPLEAFDPRIALTFLTEKICNDLDRLLLVKQLWEQTLIYARFGAKARGVEEETKKAKEEAKKVKSQ